MMINVTTTRLASLFFVATAACAADSPRPSVPAEQAAVRAPRLLTFTSDAQGFATNTYFYDTGREVVAIDAQFTPAHAQAALAYLRTQTQRPLSYLIVTHPNPDKFNGMAVFQAAGAKVVMAQATAAALPGVHAYKKAYFVETAKLFTPDTYPTLGTPDLTFDTPTYELPLQAGAPISLRVLKRPGVSSTQTVVHLPAVQALVVGDLLHYQTHAWLEGGIVNGKATPTLADWKLDLRELASTYAADGALRVYGGRGPAAPLATAVPTQIAYLEHVEAALASGTATSPAALRAAMVQAYPSYAQPELVEYSAYPLMP